MSTKMQPTIAKRVTAASNGRAVCKWKSNDPFLSVHYEIEYMKNSVKHIALIWPKHKEYQYGKAQNSCDITHGYFSDTPEEFMTRFVNSQEVNSDV